MGYEKLVVVLTKDADFVRKPVSKLMAETLYGRKYPQFTRKLRNRHNSYNSCMQRLSELEKEGRVFIIRPSMRIKMKRIEKNPQILQSMYRLGINDASAMLDRLLEYISG